MGASDLRHGVQWNGVKALLHAKEQSFDDGKGQRQLQAEGGALPGAAHHVDRAFQPMQYALHNIQTDAAAGNFGDLVRRAESRAENEIEDVGLAEPAGFFAL